MPNVWFVRYGRAGTVGVILGSEAISLSAGNAVVVNSPMGCVLGEILGHSNHSVPISPLTLIRNATIEDHERAQAAVVLGERLVEASQESVAELCLPLVVVDADVALDATAAWLHVLRWETCRVDLLITRLEQRFSPRVGLLDLSRLSSTSEGCNSCSSGKGCGSGCGSKKSSGGCSGCSCRGASNLSTLATVIATDTEGSRQRRRVALL